MTRRYEEYRSPGQHNSLWYWARTVAPYRVVINFLVIATARYLPWLPLKNALYRRIGMTVGKRVSVGPGIPVKSGFAPVDKLLITVDNLWKKWG